MCHKWKNVVDKREKGVYNTGTLRGAGHLRKKLTKKVLKNLKKVVDKKKRCDII